MMLVWTVFDFIILAGIDLIVVILIVITIRNS